MSSPYEELIQDIERRKRLAEARLKKDWSDEGKKSYWTGYVEALRMVLSEEDIVRNKR